MKKLTLLKSLIDFLWIVTCIPLIPLTLFFSGYMFYNEDILKVFNANVSNTMSSQWSLQIIILIAAGLVLVSIYSFYLFRKTLRYFQQQKPFDNFVINTFNKIGKLLMISGALGFILNFIFHLVFKAELSISLGFSPYFFVICLGLFFAVLSETFKVAKTAKEENELTI